MELESVKYKMEYSEVSRVLGHPGKPMFRFLVDSDDYSISLYRPSGQSTSYLFVYENRVLVSVISTFTGVNLWKHYFGGYSQSLPNQDSFKEIAIRLKNRRISLASRPFEKSKHTPGVGATMSELGAVYFWLPGVSGVLIGSGFVIEAVDGLSSGSGGQVIHIKSKAYYLSLLEKYRKANLGGSLNDIVSRGRDR